MMPGAKPRMPTVGLTPLSNLSRYNSWDGHTGSTAYSTRSDTGCGQPVCGSLQPRAANQTMSSHIKPATQGNGDQRRGEIEPFYLKNLHNSNLTTDT